MLWYRDDISNKRILVNEYLKGPQKILRIKETDIKLFERFNGALSLEDIASLTGITLKTVEKVIERWVAIAPDMFFDEDKERYKEIAQRMYDESRYSADPSFFTDNIQYHQTGISNAMEQFDLVEPTISHVFRLPNRALNGLTYGEAFCDRLMEMGAVSKDCQIIEIGCGTGFFANSLLTRLKLKEPSLYKSLNYTMFDLSPILQSSQAKVCKDHLSRISLINGNVEAHNFGNERYDLVIANEMIADLSVDVAKKENIDKKTPNSEAEEKVIQYELEHVNTPSSFVVNKGAIKLIEKLTCMLTPGGFAILTEYGSRHGILRAFDLSGHREYSINFDHLMSVAKKLSFLSRHENLGDFLSFDGDHEIIGMRSLRLLSKFMLPFLKKENLPFLA